MITAQQIMLHVSLACTPLTQVEPVPRCMTIMAQEFNKSCKEICYEAMNNSRVNKRYCLQCIEVVGEKARKQTNVILGTMDE